MQAILRELLGPKATDIDVEVCVVAPCMHVTHTGKRRKHEGTARALG